MNKTFKEAILFALAFFPLVLIFSLLSEFPVSIPTHYNAEGVADGWSTSNNFLFMALLIGPGSYFLLLLLPRLDPKKRLKEMGNKYFMLRLILGLFLCSIMIFITYSAIPGNTYNPKLIYTLLGALFALLGNYFQTIRPNYFVGIRTPWTLKNNEVWNKTHKMAGKLWFVGGVLIVICSLMVSPQIFIKCFLGGVAVLGIVPVVYSYFAFQKIQKNIQK